MLTPVFTLKTHAHVRSRAPQSLKKNISMLGKDKDSKKKEIYTYEAPWPIYGMNWSTRSDHKFRLALGSFVEEYNNKVSCAFF